MSLEWKTTEFGNGKDKVTVTHLAKHKAREILAALGRPAIKEAGGIPPVSTYEFGRHELVTRTWMDAPQTFSHLQETVKRKVAIVEMPIALVQFADQPHEPTLITLWKKKTTPAAEYLKQPLTKKQVNVLFANMVRQTAKLHAAGFSHGHLKLDNFVVSQNGEPQLIDPTRLKSHADILLMSRENTSYEHPVQVYHGDDLTFDLATQYKDKFPDADRDKMTQNLQKEHAKWYNHYATKRLSKLERFEQLIQKSTLTEKDAMELAAKVNHGMGRHAKKLLEANQKANQKEKAGKR